MTYTSKSAGVLRDGLARMKARQERDYTERAMKKSTEKTPSPQDWEKAETKATRKQKCRYCGEPGHNFKSCPKYLRRHLGQ